MNVGISSAVSSFLSYIALPGFIVFIIYIMCITMWLNRLYRLIVKSDPDFFGIDNKLFLAKSFARSSMLNVILTGRYKKIRDKSVVKKCDKCRIAALILFVSFASFVISMMIGQIIFGHG